MRLRLRPRVCLLALPSCCPLRCTPNLQPLGPLQPLCTLLPQGAPGSPCPALQLTVKLGQLPPPPHSPPAGARQLGARPPGGLLGMCMDSALLKPSLGQPGGQPGSGPRSPQAPGAGRSLTLLPRRWCLEGGEGQQGHEGWPLCPGQASARWERSVPGPQGPARRQTGLGQTHPGA